MSKRHGLSKSRIALFEQCPRRLWLSVHRPKLAEVSGAVRSSFADGHRVGALACSLHPDGIMIDDARGLSAALDETSRLLAAAAPAPLFEAALFPDLAPVLTSLAARLVDLLPVARRHYYHRDMRGSWSIKAVLPTLGVPGYEDLGEVRSGTDAQAGYLEAIDLDTNDDRHEELRIALLAYCERDTEAMMIVLDRLTRPAAAGAAGSC